MEQKDSEQGWQNKTLTSFLPQCWQWVQLNIGVLSFRSL
jgi:hypothetical protein